MCVLYVPIGVAKDHRQPPPPRPASAVAARDSKKRGGGKGKGKGSKGGNKRQKTGKAGSGTRASRYGGRYVDGSDDDDYDDDEDDDYVDADDDWGEVCEVRWDAR